MKCDIDLSFFGFEVCINFVRMRSENVPHLYFWHTAIGIQNQKCRLCDFPCAENNYIVIYQSLENKCFILRGDEIIPRPKVVAKIRQCFTVSVNQSSGRPSLFSDRPDRKKPKKCNRASTFCSTCFLLRTTRDHNSALKKEVVPKPEWPNIG